MGVHGQGLELLREVVAGGEGDRIWRGGIAIEMEGIEIECP